MTDVSSTSSVSSPRVGARLISLLLERVQLAAPGSDPLPLVAALYTDALVSKFGWTPESARQSWVAVSGNSFQGTVRYALNNALQIEGIRAVGVSELQQYGNHLRGFLTLQARRRCVQASFDAWPDNDIMLLTRVPGAASNSPRTVAFAILSCKTSFHARETES